MLNVAPTAAGAASDLEDFRKQILDVRDNGYELDDLVVRARDAVKVYFQNSRNQPPPASDNPLQNAAAALEQARAQEGTRAEALSQAMMATRAAEDALEAARSAREEAVGAQAAAYLARRAMSDANPSGVSGALRDAAQCLEQVREHVDNALRHADSGSISDAVSTLTTALELTTVAAQRTRGAAEALTGGASSTTAKRSSMPSIEDIVTQALTDANGVRGEIGAAIGKLTTAATFLRMRENTRNQDHADAHRRVLDAEEALARLNGSPKPGSTTPDNFPSPIAELKDFVDRNGLRAFILSLTQLLDRNALTETQRLLLSTEGVYETVLLRLLKDQKTPTVDSKAVRLAVVGEVDGTPRSYFLEQLLAQYVTDKELSLTTAQQTRILTTLKDPDRSIPLKAGATAKALDSVVVGDKRSGNLPTLVDSFAARGAIDAARFTPGVKSAMVDYLENLGLRPIDPTSFNAGNFDDFFAQAYHFAVFGDGTSGAAPIRAVTPSTSDFDMDTFELAEDQGVVKEHILAAAALYEMFMLGDQLGIFDLPTALMLRRARGRLDLSRGTGSFQLQEYKRFLRTAPLTGEDRQLLYKRVFGEGSGDALEGTVINSDYGMLWDSLMREIGDYIRKTDANSSDLEDKVSRGPVKEAVRNLQYNLSFFATDVADDVRDLKQQFDMASAILQNPDIVSSVVAGPRQNMWTVIERLIAEDLHKSVNVAALRALGIEGYKILRFVANFDDATSEADFQTELINRGEKWIIAQASLGRQKPADDSAKDDFGTDDTDKKSAASQDDWES